MLHSLIDNPTHMIVIQRIEYIFSFFTELHQFIALQHPQLMGDRCLRHSQHLCDIAYTKLRFKQCIQNFNPGRISENLKKLRQIIYRHGNDFARDKLILTCAFKHQLPNNLREHLAHIADISLPEFSVKGRDVIAAGIQDNRKIGEVLDELEELWIESDFQLSHQELLDKLPELITQKSA